MPLVPIMPTSGAKRCMLPPRPCEQPLSRPKSSATRLRGETPLARAWPWPRCVLKTTSSRRKWAQTPGGDRLFADVGVAGPVDQAPLVGARELFLAPPDRLHLAVKRQHSALVVPDRLSSHRRHPTNTSLCAPPQMPIISRSIGSCLAPNTIRAIPR